MWSVQCQYVTLLSVEVHVATRSDLRPDPEFDEIRALFYCLHVDRPATATDGGGHVVPRDLDAEGVVVVSRDKRPILNMTGVVGRATVEYVDSEIDLLSTLTSLVIQYVMQTHTHIHTSYTRTYTHTHIHTHTVFQKNIHSYYWL